MNNRSFDYEYFKLGAFPFKSSYAYLKDSFFIHLKLYFLTSGSDPKLNYI